VFLRPTVSLLRDIHTESGQEQEHRNTEKLFLVVHQIALHLKQNSPSLENETAASR
jgi:hypothetical protein